MTQLLPTSPCGLAGAENDPAVCCWVQSKLYNILTFYLLVGTRANSAAAFYPVFTHIINKSYTSKGLAVLTVGHRNSSEVFF